MRVDKFVKAKLFLEKAKESEANVIIDRKTVVAISDYINQIEAVNEYLQVKCFSDKDQMTAMAIRCEIQERVRADMRIRELEAEVQRLKGIINKDVLLVTPRSGKTEKVRQMILIRANEIKAGAVKEFAHFLIDKSENGVISVADLPEYVIEMRSRIDERFEVSENKVE